MTPKKVLLGLTLVAFGAVAVMMAKQKYDTPKADENKAASATHGEPLKAPPPTNNKELNKLNAMQSEIGQLSDENLAKEIETVKTKAEHLGLIKGAKPQNFDMNANPEAKEVLMRMALLRVEKAKRDRKQAAAASASANQKP